MNEHEDPLAFFVGLKHACIVMIPFWLVVCACLVILLKVMK